MSKPPVPRSQEILESAQAANMPPQIYRLLCMFLTIEDGATRALGQSEEARIRTLEGLRIAAGKGVAECMGFHEWLEPKP